MDHSDSHNKPAGHHQKHHQPSTGDLFSSAKFLAEAAKSSMGQESDKVDKAKVAGAAEDLLAAASQYGKFEEKSYGKYVEKAETYLHQYHSSHSSTTTTTANSGHSSTTTTTTSHSSTHSDGHGHGGDDAQSGSGYGEYFKMAEGFLKKH